MTATFLAHIPSPNMADADVTESLLQRDLSKITPVHGVKFVSACWLNPNKIQSIIAK